MAEQQLAEVRERIIVGKLAETEIAAVEAEKATRLEQLINARAELVKKRLLLIRLLKADSANIDWNQEIVLVDTPEMAPIALENVEDAVQFALKNRSDLGQAWLLIEKNELEIVRTRNGLLPYRKALLNLYRMEGSLLERRGMIAQGW